MILNFYAIYSYLRNGRVNIFIKEGFLVLSQKFPTLFYLFSHPDLHQQLKILPLCSLFFPNLICISI